MIKTPVSAPPALANNWRPSNTRASSARGHTTPTLMFYCQHSLGIGHLTRSLALVEALTGQFKVVFLNGGRMPAGLTLPAGIDVIDLPALGMDDGHTIVSRDAKLDVDSAKAQRARLIEAAVQRHRPQVLLVELFPFGRKKFMREILTMIAQVRTLCAVPARVVCSVRDILVDVRPDQQHHDERAAWLLNRYFDLVLVHADPALCRLEDSFAPRRTVRPPVQYTGYVVPKRATPVPRQRQAHLLVSAGGGIVGEPLFNAVLQARQLIPNRPPLRIVAGPFLPADQWRALQQRTAGETDVVLLRQVPDMVDEMRSARASISQCGYNTALDIVISRVPALVMPYQTVTENEQSQRAEKLAALGALRRFNGIANTGAALADEIAHLLQFEPADTAINLAGAQRSADLIAHCYSQAVQV